tara:strand:+ start:997 stop:2112 length:1116 start_codon:yes stop_codon:yes gene_type:complete
MLDAHCGARRVPGGDESLCQKYHPTTVSELCTPSDSIEEVRALLGGERYFAICSTSGSGATTVAELLCKERDFVIHTISCSNGLADTLRILKENMCNVLLAIQSQNKRVIYFLKDITFLHKGERSQIMKIVEEGQMFCIMFITPATTTAWKTVRLKDATKEAKLDHLAWIASEENLTVSCADLERLAEYPDLRNAITCLALHRDEGDRSTLDTSRDQGNVEAFSKILYAHEIMKPGNSDFSLMVTFTDLFAVLDISEFRPTRDWFTNTIADFVDRVPLQYGSKQTHVARHAQICHRVVQLKRSCKILGIEPSDIDFYTKLYRHMLLQGSIDWCASSRAAESVDDVAKAIYMIAKIRATASQCKVMKRKLQI